MFESVLGELGRITALIFSETTMPVFRQIFFLAGGILAYAFFIYNFYHAIAKRDFVNFKGSSKSKFVLALLGIVKIFFILPLAVFLSFSVVSILLLLVSDLPTREIFILSIAIISAVRIAAYYKEELATEIAKTLPIVLLATMLSKPNFLMFSNAIPKLTEAVTGIGGIFSFLAVVLLIELTLRSAYVISSFLREKVEEKEQPA